METPKNLNSLRSPGNPWGIVSTIIVIVILLVVGTILVLHYLKKDTFVDNLFFDKSSKTEVKLVTNKLDGTKVDSTKAKRHPLAIIVENHPEARPQAGLDKASLIYEAISEGGITRFMAIYGPRDAGKVGPVRSARTYFVDWASEFDAFLAHVGGNLDALDKIKAEAILDLDQFGLGEPTYWREPEPGKAIEHTMFTKTDALYKVAGNKGWPISGEFEALNFRDPKPNKDATQKISVDFSESQYKVDWEYDPSTNTYLRTMGGVPHRDRDTGDRLAASNLIIQEVDRWEAITTINEQGWAMKTIGSGNAKIFIEGKETNGTWKKTSRTSRTLFYDLNGKEISFIPGVFWYEITPPEVFKTVKVL